MTVWAVTFLFTGAGLPGNPPTVFPPWDFVEYWSAARVFRDGGNPYDGAALLPLQKYGYGEPAKSEATMLWTPPWTLPLYLPFGEFDIRTGQLVWLAVQVLCVLVAVRLVWGVYSESRGWALLIPFAAAVTFAPPWWLAGYGQNTGFILLGLAGFLALRKAGYPVLAGAVGALTAIKPHLLALYGLAILLDASSRAGRRVILGGALTLAAGSAVAVAVNPAIFGQYVEAVTAPSSPEATALKDWRLPLLSYKLRLWVDPARFWIQFAPLAAGAVLLVPYWWARRRAWDWPAEAPRLVAASVVLAPYGAWLFDLVVLLVPVVQVFAWVAARRDLIPASVAVAGHLVMLPFAASIWLLHDAIWVPPAVAGWYAAVAVLYRRAVPSVAEGRS